MIRPLRRHLPSICAFALAACLGGSAGAQPVDRDVVYVPTPQEVVDRMLQVSAVRPGEVVLDLGCGDGRMVVTAGRLGARGVGVDIDPQRIAEANENARAAGVSDRVEFRIGNLFAEDLGQADVLAVYLLTEINARLRPKILGTMKVGARVASHAFDMGDWEADGTETVGSRRIFSWIVPARDVGGTWRVEGDRPMTADLVQRHQVLSGTARIGDRSVPVSGRLRGAVVTLTLELDGKPQTFTGRIDGNRAVGTGWTAVRS